MGCSPAARLGLKKSFEKTEEKFHDHTGFILYDLEKDKTIYEFNASKYFTPASNTKIFTLYASLKILGDSVPALKYVEKNDSLIFWGTGDPSFLYKFTFNNNRVYNFLASTTKKLYFSFNNFSSEHFGPGWAWDDYNSAYASERSPLPVYGNIFTVQRKGSLVEVTPTYFDQYLSVGERKEREGVVRSVCSNEFKFHPGLISAKNPVWDVPMRIDPALIVNVISDTLKKTVSLVDSKIAEPVNIFYSIPTDSLYRVMMQDSDNFIAEQLLLMCAGVVRDTLKTEIAIQYVKENYLADLPDKPVWIDGSGLSRYNLFTPRTMAELWKKIYATRPREKLFPLLATGGKNGTVKNWFKADVPYIFGKTGTLSNNHSLSGYLVTKSGKTLIFAFMNNNYVATTSEIRRNMQEIIYNIYSKY